MCVFHRKNNDFQYVALPARRHDSEKNMYFLSKTNDFQYVASLAQRPDSSKCMYFRKKTKDFQYVALLARRHDSSKCMYFLWKTVDFQNKGSPSKGPPRGPQEPSASTLESPCRHALGPTPTHRTGRHVRLWDAI